MKLYFAAINLSEYKVVRRSNEKALMSYFYLKDKTCSAIRNDKEKIFIDSGAFSAFSSSKQIDIDEYITFLKTNHDITEVRAILDVIGDWKSTRKNLEHMEKAGIDCLPVFHYGSPLKYLQELVQKYDYIAFGGLVPMAKNRAETKKWLDACWLVIYQNTIKKGKPLTKVHGFGVNAYWSWQTYPWYSVDANSWKQSAFFGSFTFSSQKIKYNSRNFLNEAKVTKRLKVHNSLGKLEKRQERENLFELQIKDYSQAAKNITELWTARGITFED